GIIVGDRTAHGASTVSRNVYIIVLLQVVYGPCPSSVDIVFGKDEIQSGPNSSVKFRICLLNFSWPYKQPHIQKPEIEINRSNFKGIGHEWTPATRVANPRTPVNFDLLLGFWWWFCKVSGYGDNVWPPGSVILVFKLCTKSDFKHLRKMRINKHHFQIYKNLEESNEDENK
ncbi:hypothetical protein M8C21_015729, partial [Ambrosia artemisiifolia]